MVELAGRLVREEEPGTMCERCRDCNALLLAAGELGGTGTSLVGETDAVEQLVGTALTLARSAPRETELESD